VPSAYFKTPLMETFNAYPHPLHGGWNRAGLELAAAESLHWFFPPPDIP
jgi:hypothetical protein